jgi:hypothetical protein
VITIGAIAGWTKSVTGWAAVQAGSDAVLSAMRRGYTVVIRRAEKSAAGYGTGTGYQYDVIVGFPGETGAVPDRSTCSLR